MGPDEWADVLNHLRKRVREVGLADLDDLIASDFRMSPIPSSDVLRYLDILISALNERSQLGYRRALEALRDSVDSESGQPIEGIEVAITEDDVRLFRRERIDLASTQDYTEVVAELTAIRDTLRKEASAAT